MAPATFSIVIGLLELFLGIPMLANPEATTRWMRRFRDSDSMRVVGFLLFAMAFLVLLDNGRITWSVQGFVIFAAWLTVGKCLVLTWFPSWYSRCSDRFVERRPWQLFIGVAACAWGVVFLGAGFALR